MTHISVARPVQSCSPVRWDLAYERGRMAGSVVSKVLEHSRLEGGEGQTRREKYEKFSRSDVLILFERKRENCRGNLSAKVYWTSVKYPGWINSSCNTCKVWYVNSYLKKSLYFSYYRFYRFSLLCKLLFNVSRVFRNIITCLKIFERGLCIFYDTEKVWAYFTSFDTSLHLLRYITRKCLFSVHFLLKYKTL